MEHRQTQQIAHLLALFALMSCALFWAWSGRIEDGHWRTLLSNQWLHPIPTIAWLVVMVPSALSAIGGLVVIAQASKNRLAAVEGIFANLMGSALLGMLLWGWALSGL